MPRDATIADFPRPPLYGAIALVLMAIASVALMRLGDVPKVPLFADATSPSESRKLVFRDQADGSISVIDADTAKSVAVVKPGTNGFLRGALRGIARARKRDGGDMSIPFELARWPNGHLTLEDPSNGTVVDLAAFGHTNAAVFGAFIPLHKGTLQ
jgi:putative photosynthetic complex assembly protein